MTTVADRKKRNRSEYQKAYRAANAERKKETARRYQEEHGDEIRARDKARHERDKEKRNRLKREVNAANPRKLLNLNLRKYGITVEDYDRMVEEQGGVCKICQEPCSRWSRLSVDHCHTTGSVRGLLCMACNHGLGSFRDSPLRLQAAIRYLTERPS